jgi:hypothetical protein
MAVSLQGFRQKPVAIPFFIFFLVGLQLLFFSKIKFFPPNSVKLFLETIVFKNRKNVKLFFRSVKCSKIVQEGWVIDYFALALGMNAQLKEL